MTRRYVTTMPSPVGELTLRSDGERLTGLSMHARKVAPVADQVRRPDRGPFQAVISQLAAYFAGELKAFDLLVAPQGTAFQLQVWQELQEIPYGQTRSYQAIAEQIGNPRAVRAVGLANGRNPIGIVIPCHRVIGADGSLTGYGGGLERKRFLLRLESAYV
jgi:methylated-DNA-[protein]-cysteine S-methyltransferase